MTKIENTETTAWVEPTRITSENQSKRKKKL